MRLCLAAVKTLGLTALWTVTVCSLSQAWAASHPKAAVPQPSPDIWTIGVPDLVLEMPAAFKVPAKGVVEYQYVIIPTNLTEDRWVVAAEVRPGDRAVVHHAAAQIREPGSEWMRDRAAGVVFVPPRGTGHPEDLVSLAGYAPGQLLPTAGAPARAILLKAGSDIVLQIHYTTNGHAASDRTSVGLIFEKHPTGAPLVAQQKIAQQN